MWCMCCRSGGSFVDLFFILRVVWRRESKNRMRMTQDEMCVAAA